MPPLKAGLSLKRKIETENKVESKYEQESSNTKGLEELTLSELNIEGDSTDSEHEGNEEGSDQDQDEVLFKDSDVSSLEDEDVEYASDESSELTDSEAEGESVNSNDNNNADSEDSDTESDAESGIGHTHGSSSSESEKQILKNKQKKKIAKQKIKTKKPDKDLKEKSQNKKGTTSKGSVDRLADVIEGSSQMQPVEQKDEYESGDTSDEEERRNTVGDIPMWWYNEYPHIGYDLDGRKIVKPPQRDQIDEFLKKCEDPDFWRTVRDPSTGQDVVLSKEDLQLIQRIREGQVPNPDHDEYQPWVEWFSREVLATPLRAFPEHKRSFLPSRSEQLQIAKIVHALKMGWTKTRKQLAAERRDRREKKFYNLWGSTGEGEGRALHRPVPPPRRPPPPHAESYNPPPEYLLDAKEMKEWNKLKETPWKRKYTFLPTRHASLREVPAYQRFVRERFLRCLDLYLAPRAIKMRLTISASELVPRLPSPRELQPFPTGEALCLRGHAAPVRSVDFEPSGQYIVSGGDDGAVKIWETSTGRCLRTIELGEPVSRVLWSPAPALWLVAAAAGSRLLLLNPGTRIGHHRRAARTDLLLDEPPPQHDVQPDERTASAVKWERVTPEDWAKGIRIAITHFKPIVHVSWHGRGDYVAASVRAEGGRAVCVHQVSRRRSQLPLARLAGQVQAAHFHPARPLLAVATQRAVRLYDLLKQELVRKLRPGAQWISDFAFHPAGDNMLVASYDRKCMWFDLELSPRPYQTLRLHGGAVRALAFHRRYPLFATGGDDAHVVVSHGMVYNDLLQNPLIVPLKQIRGPEVKDELCVLDLRFHPTQPWLLAAGADSTIRLYS